MAKHNPVEDRRRRMASARRKKAKSKSGNKRK